MVDNSLGRLWLENYNDSSVKNSLKYYLDDEQTEVVRSQIDSLNNQVIDIESLSFLDPSCGSGHILVYAFELFYKLYLSRGYRERDIPELILKNNIFGLDIDKRATQLATFALVMKAREYDRRLFNRDFVINIFSIEESNVITPEQINHFSKENHEVKVATEALIGTFYDGKLYGSIIQVPHIHINLIEEQIDSIRDGERFDLFTTELIEYIFPLLEDLISQYKLLERQYDVVVTNPPYMGSNGMNTDLKKFINEKYKEFNRDLFSVFIYRPE